MIKWHVDLEVTQRWSGQIEADTAQEASQAARDLIGAHGETVDWEAKVRQVSCDEEEDL